MQYALSTDAINAKYKFATQGNAKIITNSLPPNESRYLGRYYVPNLEKISQEGKCDFTIVQFESQDSPGYFQDQYG